MSHCGPKHECACGYTFTEPAPASTDVLELLRECRASIYQWVPMRLSDKLLPELDSAIAEREKKL